MKYFDKRLDIAKLTLMRYCILLQAVREMLAEQSSLHWMLVLLCADERDETSASTAYARLEHLRSSSESLLANFQNGANSGSAESGFASAVSSENDEYSQRTYVKYGNGVETHYEYDREMRWLESIATKNLRGVQLQNMRYTFDDVGNITQYINDCLNGGARYKTEQTYSYDGLYQLTSVTGNATNDDYASSSLGNATYKGTYTQKFSFDAIGNMMHKVSVESVTSGRRIGDDLTYSFDYVYDENFAHRLKRAGNEQNGYRHFSYDANGNVIEEKDTISANPNEETSGLLPATMSVTSNANGEKVYSSNYAWGYFKDVPTGSQYGGSYKRSYSWDSRNLLIASSDNTHQVYYTYDANGERTNKYTHRSETLYFNTFWNWHKDSAIPLGQYSKNIYLGTTRLVTKLHNRLNELPAEQSRTDNCYYYHSDHLGSAQLITDYKGNEYQRLEYTPYGELWIEKTSSTISAKYLPYKFTGKERDEETGLYYFGARYLDAKYSRWLSADPALNDYMAGTSSGEGGIYNHVNLSLYHYGGNNPIRYTDPTGLHIDDWQDNGDGTWTVLKQGATLWDIYGKDWKEKSGYEGDPTKLQIGDTVGIKNELGVDIPDVSGGEDSNHLSNGNTLDMQNKNSSSNMNGFDKEAGLEVIGLGGLLMSSTPAIIGDLTASASAGTLSTGLAIGGGATALGMFILGGGIFCIGIDILEGNGADKTHSVINGIKRKIKSE